MIPIQMFEVLFIEYFFVYNDLIVKSFYISIMVQSPHTDPKFIKEYWQRIGEIPESITERNKANKRLLKDLQSVKHTPKRKGSARVANQGKRSRRS